MALGLCQNSVQNFVSTQYLENGLIECLPNFVCALVLTRSRLELLPVIFRKFVTELWPLIDVLLNALITNV